MNLAIEPATEYADLEIRILERLDAGYPVELTLNGEQEFPRGYLAADVLPWVPSASPTEDGERLFRLLFADERLSAAWAEIRGQTPLRRVHLRIDPSAPELHAIPWELLREVGPNQPPQTLAATVATPFSRDLAGKWRPIEPVAARPIKLLVAIVNPDHLADYGLPPIDVDAEQRAIRAALAELSASEVKLDFLPPPVTLSSLEAALKNGGIHVLHIVAHGMYHPQRRRAILFLADDANGVARVGEEAFAEMLARQRESLRLVFLASCQSATRSPADAFRGFAPQLIAAGVPTVVAMQDLVPVETARAFANTFYRQLLRHGLVDVAANEARSLLMSGDLAGSWSAPVLFSRMPAILAPSPSTLPWWKRLRQNPVITRTIAITSALFAIVSAIALVLGLTGDISTARQPGGVLHPFWPAPTDTPTPVPPMASGFNVAVARFTTQDAHGQFVATNESTELSEWLFTAIKKGADQLPSSLRVDLREPAIIGVIDGADRQARAKRAAEVASRHNATMLIYGVVTQTATGYQVEPEFYVADQAFGYGSEVAGSNRLGQPVAFVPPIDPASLATINAQLYGRSQALQHIVGGLAQFYIRRYEQAWAEFQEAATTAPPESQAVLQTLIGAAKLRAYDQEVDPTQRDLLLSQASEAFSQSYQLDRGYARSYLGLGAVALAQAQAGPGQAVDVAKLLEASRWYSDSLGAADQPPTAYVPIKAAYGLGQAHLLGVDRHLAGWSADEARRLFQQVTQAYDSDQALDLAWFAGHAHASLGRLAAYSKDWPAMAAEYHKAIDILRDIPNPPARWLALYWSSLGFAEARQQHLDQARLAYENALKIGAGAVPPEKLKEWQTARDQLGQ
jgi:hypothetical protein